jgi:hypothetical protein
VHDEAASIVGWRKKKYRRIDQPRDSIVQILITEKGLNHSVGERVTDSNIETNDEIEKMNKWLVSQHKVAIEDSNAVTTTTEISVAFRLDQVVEQLTKKNQDEEKEQEERYLKEASDEDSEIERDEDEFDSNEGELDEAQFLEKWLHFVRVYQQFSLTLECHNVFAFLPLRSYGFRFTLQADWKVTSSREAVDSSSKWNQTLRDEIPSAFAAALKKLIEYATKDEIMVYSKKVSESTSASSSTKPQALRSDLEEGEILSDDEVEYDRKIGHFSNDCLLSLNLMFHFIPAKNQVAEFFSCVPALISQKLLSMQFIPTTESTFELPRNVVLHPLNERAISPHARTCSIEDMDAYARGDAKSLVRRNYSTSTRPRNC